MIFRLNNSETLVNASGAVRSLSRTGLVILLVISACIGLTAYGASRFNSSTLTLKVRTLEKGPRFVWVTGKDDSKPAGVVFEISNDTGEPSLYAIELPRLMPGMVRIPPLAGAGAFQIDGISLSNAAVSYNWDESMVCSQKRMGTDSLQQGPCGDNAPSITVDADAAIVISSIPETTEHQ